MSKRNKIYKGRGTKSNVLQYYYTGELQIVSVRVVCWLCMRTSRDQGRAGFHFANIQFAFELCMRKRLGAGEGMEEGSDRVRSRIFKVKERGGE